MRVQEIVTTSGQTRYVVIDGNGDWVEPVVHYLRELDSSRSRNTLRAYAHDLRLFFEFLDQRSINYLEVTIDDMVGFVSWLKISAGGKVLLLLPIPQARKNVTINRILTAVAGFYAFLYRHEMMDTDVNISLHEFLPARARQFKGFLHHLGASSPVQAHLLRQRRMKSRPKTLTSEEMSKLLAAAGNARDRLLLKLLYTSALRIGEALALWMEDISIIPPSLTVCDRGELVNGAEIKTPSSLRTVEVSRELVNEIMRFVATEHTYEVETNHIFIKMRGPNKGKPLSYPEVNDLFQRLKAKTGIDASAHILRHTAATELYRLGWDIAFLQERLGHAHAQTTIDAYVHLSSDDMLREWEKVEDKLRIPDLTAQGAEGEEVSK